MENISNSLKSSKQYYAKTQRFRGTNEVQNTSKYSLFE
jgi:hypothetical protein